jgi:hypothetical protein
MSVSASRAAKASGTAAAHRRIISTPSDQAATAGTVIRERRRDVPWVTGARPGRKLRFPPAERTLRPDRSGNVTARHSFEADLASVL